MNQKIIKPPKLDALICNEDNNTHYLCPQNTTILQTGTNFKTQYRTLLQFDLSTLPFFSTITRGTLNVFFVGEDPETTGTLGVFQVLSEWDPKTVTWSKQPLVSASPEDTIAIPNQAGTLVTFNITTLLQNWNTNRAANLGVMLKFIDESCCSLFAIAGKQHHDSRFWPYLELTFANQLSHSIPIDSGKLRATPLDQPPVSVTTAPAVQFTSAFNVLVYDYSYLVVNTGANPALVFLQVGPDGVNFWENQTAITTVNPGTVVSLVPDVIAKFARVGYQSQPASPNTTLQIYLQGRTYN